jgi:dolichol-phosphate mannosyltransferase
MEKVDLSIIIPMFNEGEVIDDTIRSVASELDSLNLNWEIILVNDGSTDNTLDLCRQASVRDDRVRIVAYSPNRGRGYALRQGFETAAGDVVISIDADLTYSPDHITLIWNEMKKNESDIVLGSAYMKGGKVIDVPFKRVLISRIGNLILGLSFPGKIKTITCVLRGYKRGVLDSLELESDDKEIHLEILAKAISVGFRIKEIPAVLKGRKKGKSKFKFKATSISHLAFSFYQKPMIIFGVVGIIMVLGGFALGIVFIIQKYTGTLNPTRPIFLLMILLLLAGIQMLSFGFIANQVGNLKKEIYKIQKESKTLAQFIKKSG